MRTLLATLVTTLLGVCAAAQEPQGAPGPRPVTVRVVSATTDSVWLDHGRDIGLEVGDRVTLFPPGGGDVEVVVRSLTHSSARCEPDPGVPVAPVGTTGEALVRGGAAARAAGRRDVPAHPPWTRPIEPRSSDQPLLVPTFGKRPEDRAAELHGRLFGFAQLNRDRQGGDSEYLLARTGLRATGENLLGHADVVRLAGEWSLRDVSIEGRDGQTDNTGRLDLASVAFGNEAYAPVGVEAGRFLSRHLPEIGLVDGVEAVLRYEGGVRVGGGVGAYPRPFPARNSGDDVGVHAFVDYVSDDRRTFAAALGVQKTWHRGAADRDLVIVRGEWRPTSRWTVLGNAKVDFYLGDETIESADLELTELLAQVRYRGDDAGWAVVGSHFGWPELERAEYQLLSPELVRDGAVDRVAVSGWWRPRPWATLRLRGDRFEDQARDGTSARADAELRDLLADGSDVLLSGFRSEGGYTSGPGASLAVRQRLAGARLRLGYRWHRYTLDALVTGPETRVRESLQLGCAWQLSPRCDLDLQAERWFGDGQDAFAVGLFVQWRL
ncbi:MAG: hypothetical protein KAI24_15090 [Planctomycetes bacterium]|nr:hypothetical protein [Planctomycetota bacterium]